MSIVAPVLTMFSAQTVEPSNPSRGEADDYHPSAGRRLLTTNPEAIFRAAMDYRDKGYPLAIWDG